MRSILDNSARRMDKVSLRYPFSLNSIRHQCVGFSEGRAASRHLIRMFRTLLRVTSGNVPPRFLQYCDVNTNFALSTSMQQINHPGDIARLSVKCLKF